MEMFDWSMRVLHELSLRVQPLKIHQLQMVLKLGLKFIEFDFGYVKVYYFSSFKDILGREGLGNFASSFYFFN